MFAAQLKHHPLGAHRMELDMRGYIKSFISFLVAFTAADATACPYLQLGALLCAGLQGLRDALPTPDSGMLDASTGNGSMNGASDHSNLPCNLSDALTALGKDEVFRSAFPEGLLEVYTNVKQSELAAASRLSPAELCEWAQETY